MPAVLLLFYLASNHCYNYCTWQQILKTCNQRWTLINSNLIKHNCDSAAFKPERRSPLLWSARKTWGRAERKRHQWRQQIRMKISEVRPQFVNASLAPLRKEQTGLKCNRAETSPVLEKADSRERLPRLGLPGHRVCSSDTVRTCRGLRRISI